MRSDFSGPVLELLRARHHLYELTTALVQFGESKPYRFSVEPDPNSSNKLLKVRAKQQLPSDRWGVIIGDFAHNARSALDHVVYQISALSDNDKKRKQLQFPICNDRTEFRRQARTRLFEVPDAEKELIEWCQPYNGCNGSYGDAFRALRELNNTDKHRLIPVVVAITKLDSLQSESGAFAGIKMSADAHIVVDRGGVVSSYEGLGDGTLSENGTTVAKFVLDERADVIMQPELSTVVRFGEESIGVEGRFVVPTLSLIYDRVVRTIDKF